MFCTKCGTPVPDAQKFCHKCGQPMQSAAAPPSTPPQAAAGSRCDWCGAELDPSQLACARCGAALKRPVAVAQSGWTKLPGRKDMAKLQIGNSSCQIEGLYVPAADMKLAAGDSVYFGHHVLLWKDPQVNITTMPMKGAWTRAIAGLPLIMMQAAGPGHIAFSQDQPGELIPLPLQPGQSIDVREHMLLVATSSVAYDWFMTGIWFQTRNGNETETHHPVGYCMDRFKTGQVPGLLVLHAGGNVFTRTLGPGQTILVKPTSLVFKDPAVQMQLHFEHPSGIFSMWRPWNNRYLWLRLTGPGRVAVKSVFEHLEGEARNMVGWSSATSIRW
jgi:uncharacterized protein (AIM24 family)